MDLGYTITQAKVPLSRTIEAERQREPMKQNVTEFFLFFFQKYQKEATSNCSRKEIEEGKNRTCFRINSDDIHRADFVFFV